MPDRLADRTLKLEARTHYWMPEGVKYVNLVVQGGGEKVHIRFSRGPDTILDIPLSAEDLVRLVPILCSFRDTDPSQWAAELDLLRRQGAVLSSPHS